MGGVFEEFGFFVGFVFLVVGCGVVGFGYI